MEGRCFNSSLRLRRRATVLEGGRLSLALCPTYPDTVRDEGEQAANCPHFHAKEMLLRQHESDLSAEDAEILGPRAYGRARRLLRNAHTVDIGQTGRRMARQAVVQERWQHGDCEQWREWTARTRVSVTRREFVAYPDSSQHAFHILLARQFHA